jgi:hypothetical protein
MKVLSSTSCQLAIFHNEDRPFPYKGARLFHILNACLGCWPPHDWWWGWVCKTMKTKFWGGWGHPLFDEWYSFIKKHTLKKRLSTFITQRGARSWVRGCKNWNKMWTSRVLLLSVWWWGFCVHFQKPVLCTLVAHGRRCVCKQAGVFFWLPLIFGSGRGAYLNRFKNQM